MTMVARNEEEILSVNLDYHFAQGVDFAIVTNHASSDKTAAILGGYERRGRVHVIRDDYAPHDQARRVTQMARLAATTYEADWVINNDADEFWWPQIGRLRDVFEAIPDRYGKLIAPRANFRPRPRADAAPFLPRMTLCETHSVNPRGYPLEPKAAHRARTDVVVLPGNHDVEPFMEAVPLPGLVEIFHFPMRSRSQFAMKVTQAGTGYKLLKNRDPSVGVDQLLLLDMKESGRIDDYFDEHVVEESDIERRVLSGELVHDARLARFMTSVTEGTHLHTGQSGKHAEVVVGTALTWKEELDALRWEASGLREELERVRQDREDAAERARELEAKLGAAWHRYDQLRNSRIMRYTQGVRRFYYRVRDFRSRGTTDAH